MFNKLMTPPSVDWPGKFKRQLESVQNADLKAFYQQGIVPPDTPLEEVTFLAMDFETTGLNSAQDDIITIGTVPFTLNRVLLNQAKHWTVRPRKQLEENSVIIHGITHSDVLDAPDLSDVFGDILREMSGKIMVVHYQRIEREFFNRALLTRINEGIEFPVVDTMQIESLLQQKAKGGIFNKLRGRKPESVRLGASRTRYGLPQYTPHHALTDAIATAELLQAQIAHHYERTTPISQFWL